MLGTGQKRILMNFVSFVSELAAIACTDDALTDYLGIQYYEKKVGKPETDPLHLERVPNMHVDYLLSPPNIEMCEKLLKVTEMIQRKHFQTFNEMSKTLH